MTEKDLMIRDLREENRKLKEQLAEREAKAKWIPADNPPEEDSTSFYHSKTILAVILEDTNGTRMAVEHIIREMRKNHI